jgi:predicted Zn-dependent protease
MLDRLEALAHRAAPAGVDRWSVRGVVDDTLQLTVRQDVAQAPSRTLDAGVMVTVTAGAGTGHAATADASEPGLAAAFGHARALALAAARHAVFDASHHRPPPARGRYATRVEQPLATLGLRELHARVAEACARTCIDSRIVDWSAGVTATRSEQLIVGADGTRIEQQWSLVTPSIQATAHDAGTTQTRSSAGQYNGYCRQGGWEVLDAANFSDDGVRVAREAIELCNALPCPAGTMDLLLMPDPMMLQIHESIGHPLELDRILGDERNFAGDSFVTLDMFGRYRWGSELLNVTHDPTIAGEFASFAYDDEGMPAERAHLIRRGVLLRPLGGALSAARARALGAPLDAVATTRACSWNRAPIDRMSNLNVEPGDSTLAQMIERTELGVAMRTNCSWSIDQSRNKFQFGCEHATMIRNGRLAEVVRNPNYRGVSATFWRSLAAVGDASTFEVMGTPFCGKGEPSQVIRVGHASPACLFSGVDVFGGAS